MEEKKSIEDLFGPLHSRLYEIKAGRAKNHKLHPTRLTDPIHKSVGSISDSEALANVDFAIAEIGVINALAEERLTLSFEPFERTDPEYRKPITKKQLDKYKNQFSQLLKEETNQYMNELNNIKNELEHRIESRQASKRDKIKLNLTVEELGILFAAFEENKIITIPNKKALSRLIAETFSSKDKDEFTPEKLYNSFSTYNVKSLDIMHQYLGNMLKSIEGFKNKIQR